MGDGEVDFIDFASGELGAEMLMGVIVPGDDEAPAGFFIESVDDAGTSHATDAAEGTVAMEQGVDDGAVLIAMSRMDDHAAGFIEDRQVFVLVKNGQGQILRLGFGGFVRGNFQRDDVPSAGFLTGFEGTAVERGSTFFDQGLKPGTRQLWQAGAEESVEPLAGLFRGDGEGLGHG